MVVASIMGFKITPEAFYAWIRPLAQTLMDAVPNPAHRALARLEELGKIKSVITQNIDMLHSRAGSKTVYEVHGHLREATCIKCFSTFPGEPFWRPFLADESITLLNCPNCGGILKPNVILFGEQLPALVLAAAERDVKRCDVMIVAGSSLEVYPVADLPRRAQNNGARLIMVNYDPTAYDRHAAVVIHGDVAEVLPQIVSAVEAKS
jgi:NAD-dependent deacetylase